MKQLGDFIFVTILFGFLLYGITRLDGKVAKLEQQVYELQNK